MTCSVSVRTTTPLSSLYLGFVRWGICSYRDNWVFLIRHECSPPVLCTVSGLDFYRYGPPSRISRVNLFPRLGVDLSNRVETSQVIFYWTGRLNKVLRTSLGPRSQLPSENVLGLKFYASTNNRCHVYLLLGRRDGRIWLRGWRWDHSDQTPLHQERTRGPKYVSIGVLSRGVSVFV